MAITFTELRRLYAYNRWATARLLRAAAALEPVRLDTPLGTSFGTLRGTIAHLYSVEQLWLDRWQGHSPRGLGSLEAEPVDAIERRWERIWEGQLAFLTSCRDADLSAQFTYQNQSGASAAVGLGDMLLHVVNHGTYHRGQIAAAIRQLGGTPVSTDFLLFARDNTPVAP